MIRLGDNKETQDSRKELSSGEVEKSFASKSKEYSELNEVINYAQDYLSFDKILRLKKIISDENNDKEMIGLAKIELNELVKK